MTTPRSKKVMLEYNKRLFILLKTLVKQRVVECRIINKIYNGNANLALEAVRKLKGKHGLNIQIVTRYTQERNVKRIYILR